MGSYIKGPWLLRGDFNTILQAEEKQDGLSKRIYVCSRFNRWFHEAKMVDLEFKGSKFTWSREMLAKRLDRAICNDE